MLDVADDDDDVDVPHHVGPVVEEVLGVEQMLVAHEAPARITLALTVLEP